MSSERCSKDRRWGLTLILIASVIGCADFSRGPSSQKDAGGTADGGTADGGATADGIGAVSFATDVYPLLAICMNCHVPGGQAADTALIFTGNATTDDSTVMQFIDASAPASSQILSKVSGNGHGGGTVYAVGAPEYETILAWIQQGAPP